MHVRTNGSRIYPTFKIYNNKSEIPVKTIKSYVKIIKYLKKNHYQLVQQHTEEQATNTENRLTLTSIQKMVVIGAELVLIQGAVNLLTYLYVPHVKEQLFIKIKPSNLGGTSGNGGFAQVDIPRNTIICEVIGTKTEDNPEDDILMPYGFKMYDPDDENIVYNIDCKPTQNNLPTCFAAIFNDCRNPLYYNTTSIVFENSIEFRNRLFLVTTKDIQENEEIYYNYGDLYWTHTCSIQLTV